MPENFRTMVEVQLPIDMPMKIVDDRGFVVSKAKQRKDFVGGFAKVMPFRPDGDFYYLLPTLGPFDAVQTQQNDEAYEGRSYFVEIWRPPGVEIGQDYPIRISVQSLLAGEETQLLGPTPYLSENDSPWLSSILAGKTYLEDFEDGVLDAPGVEASAGSVTGPGGLTDSVDGDDGVMGGSSTDGHSFYSGNGAEGITFFFDEGALGSLPTWVGIVWTDGDEAPTTFEAFDETGAFLGTIGPVSIADGSATGTTAEDRFFGVEYQGGISAIHISNAAGGIEVDHLQYGEVAPPPACDPVVTGDQPGELGTTHAMAFDGDIATFFATSFDNWQYIQVDFNCVGEFSALRRYMSLKRDPGGNRGPQGEAVSYSLDGVDWTALTGDTTNGWEVYNNYVPQAWHTVVYGWSAWLNLNIPAQARFVRLRWDGNFDFVHEIEIAFVEAAGADLAIAKTDSKDPVLVGETLTYTLSVLNNGPVTSTAVTVVDTLPGEVAFDSAGQGCAYDPGPHTVTCNIGDLSVGGTYTTTVSVIPSTEATITNMANVTASEIDPNPANDQATEQTLVNARITCAGLTATIVGTVASETIVGTLGDDVIAGLGGNDVIFGLGGSDMICGGEGDDTVIGGAGRNVIFGDAGNDGLVGGNEDDILVGGDGNDKLLGLDGNDKMAGFTGDDIFVCGHGFDLALASPGPGTDFAAADCELPLGIP